MSVNRRKCFRKLPQSILQKLNHVTGSSVIVAAIRSITHSDIVAGKYKHLGIQIQDGTVAYPQNQIPSEKAGHFSRRNKEGYVVVRRDLPKIKKTREFESPNFGDWSKGSHTVSWTTDVYPREQYGPKEWGVTIESLGAGAQGDPVYILKFVIDQALNRSDESFEDDLLHGVNLIQENVGGADVFPADATAQDFLRNVSVAWEIFPPGERETDLARLRSKLKITDEQTNLKLQDRYGLLLKLKPIAFVSGTSGFRRYFGAQFADNMVVFENLEYGNAIYVMYDQWRELSQRSRTELLSGRFGNGYSRIAHATGWKGKLESQVTEFRNQHRNLN